MAKKVDACSIPSAALNRTTGSAPTVSHVGVHPQTTPLNTGHALDSTRDFSKLGSATPGEALATDPRKNPVKP